MMDEREIEAAALDAAVRAYRPPGVRDETHRRNMRRAIAAYLATFPLDRVRDARGNDERSALNQTCCSGCTEAVRDEEPLRFRSGILWHEACLAARSPQDEDHGPVIVVNGEEVGRGEAGMLNALDRMVPPRSPQDEDHEADKTIGAAACDAHKVRIGRALTSDEVMAVMTGVQTALSRVSPSRDGSVAVEDVERLKNELQTLVDWFNDAPFLRAERLLYDLSRSSTDRPEQPEPDVPGGQPPAEPDDH